MKILNGVRVLDLGRIISAPYCAMLLADMGAEVIKVEKAGKGDDMRSLAVFDYPAMNRNKKSVTIQFRSEEGKELLRRLIEASDVLIENFRPGTMEKMGFSYEEIRKINPRMIVASISGFGQTGPYKERAAFDSIIQAMSGIMSVTGTKESGPSRIGAPILDHLSGLCAANGILMALYNREKTGNGDYIDISMFDCAATMMFTHIPNYSAWGIIAGSEDTNAPTAVPAHTFTAKNGKIYINGGTDSLFKYIRTVVNDSELLKECYLDYHYRIEHVNEVLEIVQNWASRHTVEEIEKLMTDGKVPCGIVSTIDRVVADPQLNERKAIVDIDVEGYGAVKFGANPIKLKNYPVDEYAPAPGLGAHNEEIYCGLLGMSKEQLSKLKENGVV